MLLLDETIIFIYPKSDAIENYGEFGDISIEPLELTVNGYSFLKHHVRTLPIASFTRLCQAHNISYLRFFISTDSTSIREHVKSIELKAELTSILLSQLNKLNVNELRNLKQNFDSGHHSLSNMPNHYTITLSNNLQDYKRNENSGAYNVPWQFGDDKQYDSFI